MILGGTLELNNNLLLMGMVKVFSRGFVFFPFCFGVEKFGKSFFGDLDLSRDFWGIQNNLKVG